MPVLEPGSKASQQPDAGYLQVSHNQDPKAKRPWQQALSNTKTQ